MGKPLQVSLTEKEWTDIQRAARLEKVTVQDWVRKTLRAVYQRELAQDSERKLDAIRVAARYSFPTGDIDEILAGIEQGYLCGYKM